MLYVLGFLFNHDETKVVLIEKQTPEWQRGKLNGVGGKIDPGESPLKAMEREFLEETGVVVKTWNEGIILHNTDFIMHIFSATDQDAFDRVQTMEAETVGRYPVFPYMCKYDNRMQNLYWIIPLLLDRDLNRPALIQYKD